MNQTLVIKYPAAIRIGLSLVCAMLAVSVVTKPEHFYLAAMVVAVAALCIDVHLLTYRAEITSEEIRVRNMFFHVRRIPMRDVTHLAESRTLSFVTPYAKVGLPALSSEKREALFRIIPRQLDLVSPPQGRLTPSDSLRLHRRLTGYAAIGFALSVSLFIPLLHGNPWNRYANTWGKPVLFACMGFFLALIFEGGMAYICWSYLRDIARVEKARPTVRRHNQTQPL